MDKPGISNPIMRIEGRLTRWNDDKGFGFITPTTGGQDVFTHIKAFPSRGARPVLSELVSFEIELDARGRKRATKVKRIKVARPAIKARGNPAAQWGTASLFAIPAFVLLYAVISALWRVPGYFALIYLGASLLCFLAYWWDKSAANSGGRRTPEATLHLLGVACGWPGALLAQQFLRHKSVKAEFRATFWGTVLVNIVGFIAVASPLGAQLWQPY